MKKRATSAILAIVMLFTLVTSVSATDTVSAESYDQHTVNIHEEIERALNGETDLEIDASDFVSAELINLDGTTEDIDVFTTTRELSLPASYAYNDKKAYATTVVARATKITEDHAENVNKQEFVTASMTLFWIDNFGIYNEFVALSGSWVVAPNPSTGKTATLSNRKVTLNAKGLQGLTDYEDTLTRYPTTNTFSIGDSEYPDGWLSYYADSWVTINGVQTLHVKVETGFN